MSESHVEAMSRGSLRARQLFPDLMEAASGMDNGALDFLDKKLKEAESWLFLPWTNQVRDSPN